MNDEDKLYNEILDRIEDIIFLLNRHHTEYGNKLNPALSDIEDILTDITDKYQPVLDTKQEKKCLNP